MWKILGTTNKNKRNYYIVECGCGYIGERRKDWVDSFRTTKCKRCSAAEVAKRTYNTNSFFNKEHKGIGCISRTKFGTYKFGALRRNLEFSITIEDAANVWTWKCALSGIGIDETSMSLDRIDSSKGYIVGNIQWVHKDINYMKQEYSQEVFIHWCSLVHANQQPSSGNGVKVPETVQRLGSEEPTNNLPTSAQQPKLVDDIV